MARARSIKPAFFDNDSLAVLPPHARLLFIGLWTIADREGRLVDRPHKIRAQIFPYEMAVKVDSLLDRLADIGVILRYEVDGQRYIAIPAWHKHQNPHYKEPPSEIPPPNGTKNRFNYVPTNNEQRERIFDRDNRKCVFCGSTEKLVIDHIVLRSEGGSGDDENLRTLCATCNNRRSKRSCSANDKPIIGQSSQGWTRASRADSGLRTPDSGLLTADTAPIDDMCRKFYSAYPERGQKQPGLVEHWYAENVGRAVDPPKLHRAIMDGLSRAKQSAEWEKQDGKFVCGAVKFLEGKRWEEAWPASENRETPLWTPGDDD